MSIALNSVFVSGFESRSLQYEMDPTIPPTITKPFQTQSGQRTHHKDQSISLSNFSDRKIANKKRDEKTINFEKNWPIGPYLEAHFVEL